MRLDQKTAIERLCEPCYEAWKIGDPVPVNECRSPDCVARATAVRPRVGKLGLMVLAPDGAILGDIVRRDGEPWHYEKRRQR